MMFASSFKSMINIIEHAQNINLKFKTWMAKVDRLVDLSMGDVFSASVQTASPQAPDLMFLRRIYL